MARQAAILEASASPKPGLICPDHQGAHADMDYADFVASAEVLEPYFCACAAVGRESPGPDTVLERLRPCAIRAEQTMLAAAGGANTHKGLIFSLGLICAAYGRLAGTRVPDASGLSGARLLTAEAAGCAQGIVSRELACLRGSPPARRLTAGERIYLEHQFAGIRGEAEQGFPAALRAFGRLRRELRRFPLDLAIPHVLLHLMAELSDTNLLSRGGLAGLLFVQEQAAAAVRLGGMRSAKGRAAALRLRDECARRRLSPGGSADLLALAIFFHLALPEPDRPAGSGSTAFERC